MAHSWRWRTIARSSRRERLLCPRVGLSGARFGAPIRRSLTVLATLSSHQGVVLVLPGLAQRGHLVLDGLAVGPVRVVVLAADLDVVPAGAVLVVHGDEHRRLHAAQLVALDVDGECAKQGHGVSPGGREGAEAPSGHLNCLMSNSSSRSLI